MLRSRAIRYTYARVHGAGEEPHRRMRRVRLTPHVLPTTGVVQGV